MSEPLKRYCIIIIPPDKCYLEEAKDGEVYKVEDIKQRVELLKDKIILTPEFVYLSRIETIELIDKIFEDDKR